MRSLWWVGLAVAVSGCELLLAELESDGGAQDGGASPATDAGTTPHGVFVLVKTTVEPPTHPTVNTNGSGHDVTWEDGKVTYHPFHASGSGGQMRMEFGWSPPPATIAPGATWPMTARAKVLESVTPLGWGGTTDLRINGGAMLPIDSLGGSVVRVDQTTAVGTEVVRAATGTCPNGPGGFTLHVSAPNGNKDWSVDYWYQYEWRE